MVSTKHPDNVSLWAHLGLLHRFCRINYFFEEPVEGKGWRKFFHAQWLVHGSKTLLQEAAHPRALYWLNECDDLGLECIYSACNVTILAHGQPEPLEEVTGPENNFFLGYVFHTLFLIQLCSLICIQVDIGR